ncbi:MAG: hypothetical protein H6753_04985 [Candidatus Omnitrophica bacterium]|nr:hypothetical protein [Candidatus Omnitrophota bacterium]
MTDILKNKSKVNFSVIHKFMFLEAPIEAVSAELITWGESSWWPQDCLWKYIRQTDGEIRVGTQYLIKINKPSAADWTAQVTQLLPKCLVERTFEKGLFNGFERITMEERANGTRIDYELHFKIRGLLNILMWPFLFRAQYVKTINKVMDALKDYVLEQVKAKYKE